MKKYQWKSQKLRKKNKTFTIVALSCMALALLLSWLSKSTEVAFTLILLGGGFTFACLAWVMQSRDKKLKK